MIRIFFKNFCHILRAIVNFGSPGEDARNIDEIFRKLRCQQLDTSDPEAISAACIYLDNSNNETRGPDSFGKENSDINVAEKLYFDRATSESPLECFAIKTPSDCEEKKSQSDMSISSSESDLDLSDFEETLRDHFSSTPKFSSELKSFNSNDSTNSPYSQTQWNSVETSYQSACSSKSFISNASSFFEENYDSKSADENINTGTSTNNHQRKRRMAYYNDESGPVRRLPRKSLMADTPVSSKLDAGHWRRFAMLNSAVKTNAHKSNEQDAPTLNLSGGSNVLSGIKFKEETPEREQGAIAKHIARIRTSKSKNCAANRTSPDVADSTRYYSTGTSFLSDSARSLNSSTTTP